MKKDRRAKGPVPNVTLIRSDEAPDPVNPEGPEARLIFVLKEQLHNASTLATRLGTENNHLTLKLEEVRRAASKETGRLCAENSNLCAQIKELRQENYRLYTNVAVEKKSAAGLRDTSEPTTFDALQKENHILRTSAMELGQYKRIIPLVRDLAKLIDDVTKL